MASPSTSTSFPALPLPRTQTPTTPPISLLPTPLAQTYTHIHPILLLLLSYLLFPRLVASPISTLATTLPLLALLQSAYAIICLPVASKSAATQKPPATQKPSKPVGSVRKRPAPSKGNTALRDLRIKLVPTLLSHLLTLLLGLPSLLALLILFGAPLTTHLPHTTLLAAHMSLLSLFPLFYVHGVDRRVWTEVTSAWLAFDEVWGATVGCVLGAWLGAVPIPLDWWVLLVLLDFGSTGMEKEGWEGRKLKIRKWDVC
ncbi:MAG: GPI-anchor biosynthesis (Pig-F) [Lasallia pustulata]|uniref:GPI-anchor biosynthesis (Pig-F) n=1 Tax=Lasallia pustulata TaxID=136370 RepID=A0A5M8PIF7_9LECA|nr:MAG: GPI-anchor biosynthesis (Pig-F) [Lasallia pustulata]